MKDDLLVELEERLGKAVYTKCAGRIPGCAGASWGTLKNCYRKLRHNVGHIEDPSRAERHGQVWVDETLDAVFMQNFILIIGQDRIVT